MLQIVAETLLCGWTASALDVVYPEGKR